MKPGSPDLSQYDRMLHLLGRIVAHRQHHPTTRSDQLYYELLLGYFERLRRAGEEGKAIAAYGIILPNELLYAMDIVPLHMELGSSVVVALLNAYEEAFCVARGWGLPPELCSAHRTMAAVHLRRWVPRPDFVVWSNTICGSSGKSGELVQRLWDIPGFFLDRPYRWDSSEIDYFAAELEELVSFLEGQVGRRLDWDRLSQVLAISAEMVEQERAINRLRSRVPCPGLNRHINQFVVVDWLFGGTPEGAAFARTVREEMEAMAKQGKTHGEERFRLLSIFPPPLYRWKLVDWMQREGGASLVGDPFCFHWQEWEPDFSRPLQSLARKYLLEPHSRTMHGAAREAVEAAVAQATEAKAQGAIYWASAGCPQGCAMVPAVKEALGQRAGIPTLVVDMEVNDPTFVSEEELKEKLEAFFETLEEERE